MKQKIIDPWGSELIESYGKIVKDFGLEVFSENTFPKPNRIMRRNVVFSGRGLQQIEEARKRAFEFHIPAYISLGLDPKKTIFYFQSENRDVIHMAYEFSKKITLNEFGAIYGNADPGMIFAAITQVGDVLYPQLEERMPGIIPVGIDQDPHIRLARDIVKRFKEKKFFSVSSLYHKFTPS